MANLKHGLYKLKHKVRNPLPKGPSEAWIGYNELPPSDYDESLDDFILLVEPYTVAKRKYTWICYAQADWKTGFFIGNVPTKEDFKDEAWAADLDDDIGRDESGVWEEVLGTFIVDHQGGPQLCPQEILDALEPVEVNTMQRVCWVNGVSPDRWEVREALEKTLGSHNLDAVREFEANLKEVLKERQ